MLSFYSYHIIYNKTVIFKLSYLQLLYSDSLNWHALFNNPMFYLLPFFLATLITSNHHSETFFFNNRSLFQDNQNNLVQSSHFNQIQNPIIIYCISEIDFKEPFALNVNTQLDLKPHTRQHIFKMNMQNTFSKSFTSIAIKWFVTTTPIGFKQYSILLNYQYSSIPINYDNQIKPAQESKIKTGYFITSFSNSSTIRSLNQVSLSQFQYRIQFTARQPNDYIKLTYFMFDVAIGSGCQNNNIFFHRSLEIDINPNKGVISKIPQTDNLKNLGGISKIKGSTLGITSTNTLVLISNFQNVQYFSLQIDIACVLLSNIIPLHPSLANPNANDLRNIILPTNFPPVANNQLPIFLPHQNSTLNPFPLTNIPSHPPINGSGRPLPIPSTPTEPVVLENRTVQSLIQGLTDLPIVPLPTPLPPLVTDNQPKDSIQQTTTKAIQTTIIQQIKDQTALKSVVETVHVDTKISDLAPIVIPQAPIPPPQVQVLVPNKTIESSKQHIIVFQRSYNISAWNILGYILIIWIGVSLIAIPFLCCSLKRSKNNSPDLNEVGDRIQYQPQFHRGTDIRLIDNLIVVQNPPQLVGNFKTRNSVPSEITVELVGPRSSTDPNSDAFRSDKSSEINNPLPTIAKQKQILTYEQLLKTRKSIQKSEKSFEGRKKSSGGESIVEVSKNSDDSKKQKSSSRLSNNPSSSNTDSVSKTKEIQMSLQQPIKILQDIPIEQIKYEERHHEPSEIENPFEISQNPFDIKLSKFSKFALEKQDDSVVENHINQIEQKNILKNQIEQESMNEYHTCFEPPSQMFNKQQSKISEFDVQASSRITQKIENLFGNVQDIQEQQSYNSNINKPQQKEQIKYQSQIKQREDSEIKVQQTLNKQEPVPSVAQQSLEQIQTKKHSLSNDSDSAGVEQSKSQQIPFSKTNPDIPEKQQSSSPQEIEYSQKIQKDNDKNQN